VAHDAGAADQAGNARAGVRSHRLVDVERLIEVEPRGLRVRDLDLPVDARILGGDLLAHAAACIEAVHAKPGRLSLDAAAGVAIGPAAELPRLLRAQKHATATEGLHG